MKKIITLLLTLALALSVCAMPAAAAVNTTEIKANFDVDSLEGVQADTDLYNYSNKSYTYNGAYASYQYKYYFDYNGSGTFMQVAVHSKDKNTHYANVNVVEEDGNKVVAIEKSANCSDTTKPYVQFAFLPSFGSDMSNTTGMETLRSSDVAFSFKVKLPNHTQMYIYTSGKNSGATTKLQTADGTAILVSPQTANHFESTNLYIYDSAQGESTSSTNAGKTHATDPFLRDEWTEFKLLYDYDNKTFDVYVNDTLLAEDQGLYYPDFLLNFAVRIYLRAGAEYTPTAYIDDIQLYSVADNDTKVQPNAAKSGNGTVTVAKADTVVTKDEEITYTITPDNGSYISSVTYGGTAIPAFDASGVTYKENADGKKLSVIFRDYEDSAPALMVSPFKFKDGTSTYLFMKLLKNGLNVPEYGMVMSTTEEEPTADNARVVPFTNTLNQYGYYGYEVVNNSDVQDQSFYVRPYAKVGNEYIYGNVQLVEPANILN